MNAPRPLFVPVPPRRSRAGKVPAETRRGVAQMPAEDVQKLVLELQVHQLKLERQNRELRRTQLELKKTRDRYAELYDFAPVAHLTVSAAGEILEANRHAAQLLGLQRGRLLHLDFKRFLSAKSQDAGCRLCRRTFRSTARQSAELELVNAQAKRLVVRVDAVREMRNRRKQCRLCLTDLTAQKQTEEFVRREKEFSDSIIPTAQIIILILDTQARIVRFNPYLEQLTGYRLEEVRGKNWFKMFLRETDWQPTSKLFSKAIAGDPTRGNINPIRRKDGTLLQIEWNDAPLRDADGQITGLLAIGQDVTERQRAKVALQEANQFNQQIIASAKEGIVVNDRDLKHLVWNPFMEELTGVSAAEALGKHPAEVFPFLAAAGVIQQMKRTLAGEAVTPLEIRFHVPQSGRSGWVTNSCGPLRNARGEIIGVISIITDITERIQLERELLQVGERERRRIHQDLHDGLGQLLAGAAYMISNLRKDLEARSLPEGRQSDRLLEVINEASAQTRALARGLHPVKPEPNGLMVALAALADRTKKLFPGRCRFHCRQPVLIRDNAVATHLYRIAQEAVTNAVKHGKPGRVAISLAGTRDTIQLAIKDNGAGLPVRPRRKPGMGLRIMRYRAGIISGSLAVEKAPGGGTAVVCRVPLSGANDLHPGQMTAVKQD